MWGKYHSAWVPKGKKHQKGPPNMLSIVTSTALQQSVPSPGCLSGSHWGFFLHPRRPIYTRLPAQAEFSVRGVLRVFFVLFKWDQKKVNYKQIPPLIKNHLGGWSPIRITDSSSPLHQPKWILIMNTVKEGTSDIPVWRKSCEFCKWTWTRKS